MHYSQVLDNIMNLTSLLLKLFRFGKKKTDSRKEKTDGEIITNISTALKRFRAFDTRKKFFKQAALYDRPWLIVLGLPQSGKTSFFQESAYAARLSYPAENDGYVRGVSAAPILAWHFADNAVWIDSDGKMIDADASNPGDNFLAAVRGLEAVRPKCPIDGVVLVLNSAPLMNPSNESINKIVKSLRQHIDTMISHWGIDAPVYLVFTHCDQIPGFVEFFGDPEGKWDERVLGALLPLPQAKQNPKEAFIDEFSALQRTIDDIHIRMLARETDDHTRDVIFSFPAYLQQLRDTVGVIVDLLFGKNNQGSSMVFSGFFFTSNIAPASHHAPCEESISTTYTSYFTRSLFSLIPKYVPRFGRSRQRSKKDIVSTSIYSFITIGILALCMWFLVSSSRKIHNLEKQVHHDITLKASPHTVQSLAQAYDIKKHLDQFQNYINGAVTPGMSILQYNPKKTYHAIKKAYIHRLRSAIAQPCSTMLSDQLITWIQYPQGSETTFENVKETMRAYLSLTESAHKKYIGVIDETKIGPLYEKLIQNFYFQNRTVPQNAETMVHELVEDFIVFIKGKERYLLVQENTYLTEQVQDHLAQLFDQSELYKTVIAQNVQTSKKLYLHDILAEKDDINFTTKEFLDEMYTPVGWNAYMEKEFTQASKQLDNIEDWVIGKNRSRISETFVNSENVRTSMIKQYVEDIQNAWYDYFSSLKLEPFKTVKEGSAKLTQLSGSESEIGLIIKQFGEWSQQFGDPDSVKECQHHFNELSKTMGFFNKFYKGHFPEYQKYLKKVSDALNKTTVDKSYVSVFNASDADPLSLGYDYTTATVVKSMGRTEKGYISRFIMQPFDEIMNILEDSLVHEINFIWRNDLYEQFSAYRSMYPFSNVEKEVAFQSVLEFFHPTDGTFWKTFNRTLKYYFVEKHGHWERREKPGMIIKHLSDKLPSCLAHADTIQSMFFKSDGTIRNWEFLINPQNSDLKEAIVQIGKTSIDVQNSSGNSFVWPLLNTDQSVKLTFTDQNGNEGFNEQYRGAWGLMRLMNITISEHEINPLKRVFLVNWSTRGAAKVISLNAEIQVNNSNHPFSRNIFTGFSIPEEIVAAQKKKE